MPRPNGGTIVKWSHQRERLSAVGPSGEKRMQLEMQAGANRRKHLLVCPCAAVLGP